jgi:DNA ligase-1
LIHSPEEIFEYHDKFFVDDYEGIILRDINSKYEGKRTIHLLKYKEFDDKEFEIVGANKGVGTHEGVAIWICKTETGVEFTCEEKNITIEERREKYKNKDKYLGKMLTIRYQNLGKDGVPRFGKAIAIRDYE